MADSSANLESGKYSAPALSKGLDILELLAGQSRGLKKVEIAAALDRSVSEIFRMLAVLQDRGYIRLDPENERYVLTMRLFELAHQFPPTKRLTTVASAVMEDLAQQLNQSVHLAILHGANILVIAQVDPPGNNITSVRLGARVPITHTASGACLTYRMPKERRDALCAQNTRATADILKTFEDNLAQTEARGFCESPSAVIKGVHNISVPIHSYEGEVAAALTIPYIRRLMKNHDPEFDDCRRILVEGATRISEKLGAGASGASGQAAERLAEAQHD